MVEMHKHHYFFRLNKSRVVSVFINYSFYIKLQEYRNTTHEIIFIFIFIIFIFLLKNKKSNNNKITTTKSNNKKNKNYN